MFKKNLTDLVRGIRNNKNNEQQYISQCIQEIKNELRGDNNKDKTVAIQKLTYLQMKGYDMSWAAFNVIEVMSQPKYSAKRVGYLAASQCFTETTEVVMLVTNLIRKDAMSKNQYEAGVALNSLSNICTPDLARDLAPDIVSMLTSSRPYIRKKACLVLYKIFLKFPEALRPAFARLKDKLDDPDTSVVSVAVNVICELARKNPKNYVPLAPTLFKILTTSQNNWMLIKIIKLFGALTPHEPRLAKKLIEPLTTLLNNTTAMSLLYECIQTCIVGLSNVEPVMKLCLAKLRMFLEHPDQNLKYLGLLAMNGIMQTYPKGVAEHRDLIVACLEDEDTTIRMRALELLTGMVNKKNLAVITAKLMEHLNTADGLYRDDLMEKIIFICSQGAYKFVTDFEWYFNVLIELTKVPAKQGKMIRDQLLDVAVRVSIVRDFAVDKMIDLLADVRLYENAQPEYMCEALYAAAWIVGEYTGPGEDLVPALESLVHSRALNLPPHIQGVYLQCAFKLYVKLSTPPSAGPGDTSVTSPEKRQYRLRKAQDLLDHRLPAFTASRHLEVQERACFLEAIMMAVRESLASGVEIEAELSQLFDEPLNPVAQTAQGKVPVPEGLDLDAWINEPPPAPVSLASVMDEPIQVYDDAGYKAGSYTPASEEEILRRKREYSSRQAQSGNMFYLGGPAQVPLGGSPSGSPVALNKSDLGLPSDFRLDGESGRRHKHRRHHRKDKGSASSSNRSKKDFSVLTTEEMPEGYAPEASENGKRKDDKPIDALSAIDLTDINPQEQLQRRQHRSAAADGTSGLMLSHGGAGGGRSSNPNMLPSAAPKDGDKDRRSKDRDRRHKHRDGSTSASSRPNAPSSSSSSRDKDGHRHRHHRSSGADKDRSKDKHKHRSHHRSSGKPDNAPAAAAAAVTDPAARLRKFYSDENMDIVFELKANAADPTAALVAATFNNKSSKLILSIDVDVADAADVQFVRPADSPAGLITMGFTLPAGQKANYDFNFKIQACNVEMQVPFILSYMVQTEGDASENVKRELSLPIHASGFIVQTPMDQEGFIKLLKTQLSSALQATSVHASVGTVVKTLAPLFHLTVIEQQEQRASMYGKTTQGHHVAVLVKEEGAKDQLALAVKASDQALSDLLIKEISDIFAPRS